MKMIVPAFLVKATQSYVEQWNETNKEDKAAFVPWETAEEFMSAWVAINEARCDDEHCQNPGHQLLWERYWTFSDRIPDDLTMTLLAFLSRLTAPGVR